MRKRRPRYLDHDLRSGWFWKKSLTPQRTLGERMADEVLGPSRYRIQDLQPGMCRWVTDETPHNQCYCGGKTIKSTSWCEEHYAKCYPKKSDLVATISDQHESTLEGRPKKGVHITSLRAMDYRCRQRIPPTETGIAERAD